MQGDQSLLDVIHAFWRALDRRDHATLLALITEDCVWERDRLVRGREAIKQVLEARPLALVTRHLVTNSLVETGRDVPSVSHLLTTFASSGSDTGGPLDCGPPALVADIEAVFRIVGSRPLLDEIRTQIIFLRPQHK